MANPRTLFLAKGWSLGKNLFNQQVRWQIQEQYLLSVLPQAEVDSKLLLRISPKQFSKDF